MPDEKTQQPSLEPPRLFGRRRRSQDTSTGDTAVFEDASSEPIPTEPLESAALAAPAPPAGDKPVGSRTSSLRSLTMPRKIRMPQVSGQAAAVVTGILVGAGLLGFVLLGFSGCEAIQGSESCGTAGGMGALVIVFALTVVLGRFLLAAFSVPDPGSTSFLAVGLTSVVALLLFIDVLDTWPMIFVIPAISAGSYLLSWWLTTTYVEPADH